MATSLLFCSFDRTRIGSWPGNRQVVPSIDDRLLDTAIDQFGRKGIDGASTRAIATAAGTTMSSITYHYGSKQGLYLAAARHIADQMGERMAPALAASETRSREGEGPDAALTALLTIIDRFVEVMVHPESAAWARFIVREQMEPTEAFDVLYGGVMGRLVDHLSALIVRIGGGQLRRRRGAAQDAGDRRPGTCVPGRPRDPSPRDRLDRCRRRRRRGDPAHRPRPHQRDPHKQPAETSGHDCR